MTTAEFKENLLNQHIIILGDVNINKIKLYLSLDYQVVLKIDDYITLLICRYNGIDIEKYLQYKCCSPLDRRTLINFIKRYNYIASKYGYIPAGLLYHKIVGVRMN